jgi:hypothetical protein
MSQSQLEDNQFDPYEQEQLAYWMQLRHELQRFKVELGATNLELAQCLNISRQPLVSFMQGDRPDLPIQRSNLKRLWALLTDPERIQDKKLSSNERNKREALRRAGPNKLLEAAGFLAEDSAHILEIEPERFQPIQRIVSKLANIGDSTDFIRLVDSLEAELVTKVLGFRDSGNVKPKGQPNLSWKMSSKEIKKWLKDWVKTNLSKSPEAYVRSRFEKAIIKLVASGKYNLNNSEILELYLSIAENEKADQTIHKLLKPKIQCEFKTLTFPILDPDSDYNPQLIQHLHQISLNAENKLRPSSQEHDTSLESIVLTAIVEAVVTRKTEEEEICWRYSSSATHFENMLTAIARGMGYETELELIDLSIRSLGSSYSSLVKTSVTFRSMTDHGVNQSSHQGVWVDRSAVFGTAQSVVIAVRGWLNEKLPNSKSIESYDEVCKTLSAVDTHLSRGRKMLSDYTINRSERTSKKLSMESSVSDFLQKEVIERIDQLRGGVLKEFPLLLNWYGTTLEHRYCMANLYCSHSCSVKGEMVEAIAFWQTAKISLDYSGLQDYIPLQILIDTERMLHRFYGGEQAFIEQRLWRSQLEDYLQQLREYIYQDSEHSKFKKYCDRLEFDIYLCASELFSRIGRLDFSLCDVNEIHHLEEAVSNLLIAAYYAAKIGAKQRAAHWITTVSRAYCRLGDGSKAEQFARIAEGIIERAIDQRLYFEYKESIRAEVNLAHGERLLLIAEEPAEALKYFLESLKGAMYLNFSRVISESLYGIARASQLVPHHKIGNSFVNWKFENDKQSRHSNKLNATLALFIKELDPNTSWASASRQFQQQAKHIWHQWAIAVTNNRQAHHPLEEAIDRYQFLARLR